MPPHCPVKQGYKITLHTLHATYSLTESSHTQVDHVARLVERIQPLQQQVHDILQQVKHDSLFTIRSEGEHKDTATTAALAQDLSIQHKQIDKIVGEYQDVLPAPTRVPPHFLVNQGYNITIHTLHVASSPTESSHTQVDHATRLVERIQTLMTSFNKLRRTTCSTRKITHQALDLAIVSPSRKGT